MERDVCNCGSCSNMGFPVEAEEDIHCDNQAIVKVWQAKSPREKALAHLCRKLFFLAAKNNCTVCLKHIPGSKNEIADALSRKQVSRFRTLAPDAEEEATTIPAWLTEL